jgi:hypothetical protein
VPNGRIILNDVYRMRSDHLCGSAYLLGDTKYNKERKSQIVKARNEGGNEGRIREVETRLGQHRHVLQSADLFPWLWL